MSLRKGTLIVSLLAAAGCADRALPTATPMPAAAAALAAPLVVENLDGGGIGSLRQAILDAANGSVITFAPGLGGGTITVTEELDIDKSLTIVGPAGGVTISGGDATRPFRVGNVYEVVLDNLTIRDGNAQFALVSRGAGGAIHNSGNLTIRNSTIEDNRASTLAGAIANLGGSLTILGSTLANNGTDPNTNSWGGAIHTFQGTVTIVNSTISGNSAGLGGGGIVNNQGTVTLVHTTVANNGAGTGGGILNWGDQQHAITTLVNSIVARNVAEGESAGADIANVSLGSPDGAHAKVELGASHSLVGDPLGHLLTTDATNLVGVDPRFELDAFLRPKLSDNGGATWTHRLLPDSPAIDAAGGAACLDEPISGLDQRGVARPAGAACDMGALEVAATLPPPPPPTVSALALDASGAVHKTTGVAVVSGTVACSGADAITLTVDVSQERKDRRLLVTVTGSATVRVPCAGTPTAWAAAVTGGNGVFVSGAAQAGVDALDAEPTVQQSGEVRLFWSK